MSRARRVTGLLLCGAVVVGGCGESTPDAKRTTTSAATVATAALGVRAPGVIAFRRYLDEDRTTSAIFTIKPDGRGERQVSRPPHGRIDDQPTISADGRRLAYEYCANGSDPSCHVIVSGIDGSDPTELELPCPKGPICDPQAPAWGPDGRLVLNLSWGRTTDESIERSQIVVADAAGRHARVVVETKRFGGDLGRPVWSPDGLRIAYEEQRVTADGSRRLTLDVISADGGRPRRITPPSLGAGDGPDWSPDGRWITFRTHDDQEGAPSELNAIHPDGSGRRSLTRFGSSGIIPGSSSYSPDGAYIVFTVVDNDKPADVFVMRADGRDLRPLTRTPLWDSAPDWGR